MKILFSIDCGRTAWYYKALGLARAFTSCNHECILWDIDKKSEMDSFDEFDPDIFIGQTYRITPALIECIKERPALKVVMKAGDDGELSAKISPEYPILMASTTEKRLVEHLKKETNKPDFLFIHYHEDYLERTHGNWMKNGYQVESIMNGADVFDYANGKFDSKYECDIGYVGGSWEYKNKVLYPYILPLCSDFDYKVKIFGRGWGGPQYMGFLPEGEEKNFYQSAKINICLHEPHSQDYGFDVTEKFFKLAINKAFTITDKVAGLEKLFTKDTVFSTVSRKDFQYQIYDMLKNWKNYYSLRQDYINNAYNQVLENHTYFNRAEKIMLKLGLVEEANKIANRKESVFKQMGL